MELTKFGISVQKASPHPALTFSLSSSSWSLLAGVAKGELGPMVGEVTLPSHSLSLMITSSLAWIVSISIPRRSLSSPTLLFSVLTSCWRLSFSRPYLSSWPLRPRICSSFWWRSSRVSLGTPWLIWWLVKYLSYWDDRTVCWSSRISS